MIETSMYADHFAWDRVLERPHDVRPYCKEVIMNLIAVHAQVAQVVVQTRPPLSSLPCHASFFSFFK